MYAKDVFLSEIIFRMKLLGLWPTNTYRKIHAWYSNIMWGYFSVFIISQVFQLYYVTESQEAIENLAVSLLYIEAWAKIALLRTRAIKNLVSDVRKYEKSILKKRNYLYEDNILHFHKLNNVITFVGVAAAFFFFTKPQVEEYMQRGKNSLKDEETVKYQRTLPISSWFPFDKYKYYYYSYFLQIIVGTYAAMSLVVIGGFLVGLMLHLSGRLRILQQHLTKVSNKYGLVRECIIEHQSIIRYVSGLDASLKYPMLLDFGLCTIQIAVCAFWAMVSSNTLQIAVVVCYLLGMIVQLLFYYGYAHMLTFESEAVSQAIWKSEWYKCNRSIKSTLLICIMKSQRPLVLNVGPFYAMSYPMALMVRS